MAWLRPQALILRGLPGSGKSYWARKLCDKLLPQLPPEQRYRGICTTDDYFERADGYHFDGSLLAEAHQWNQQRFVTLCQQHWPLLICANTNMQQREWQPYVAQASAAGYRLRILLIGNPQDPAHQALCSARNSHSVTAATIAAMAQRFER
jgi:hypothetical protein